MYGYHCYFSLYSKFKMPKKILVIDDNDDILDLVREVLETNNYEAICLNSSDNIIKSVTELQPDLVITDYILTGINGGEFCAEIKKNPTTKHLPVIILSAHSRVIESLGHYGQDAFVSKPFDIGELLAVIKKCLCPADPCIAL